VRDTTPPGTNVTISNDVKFTTGHGIQDQDLSALVVRAVLAAIAGMRRNVLRGWHAHRTSGI